MATELEDFPEDIPKPPHVVRNSKYNWSEWFNGNVWALKEGEDFAVTIRVFRQEAKSHAKRHGYDLKMKSDLLNRILYLKAEKLSEKSGVKKPRQERPSPIRSVRADPRVAAGTGPPRVAETPKPVDPVSLVFGEAHERSNLPPIPRGIPGVAFGEKAKREW